MVFRASPHPAQIRPFAQYRPASSHPIRDTGLPNSASFSRYLTQTGRPPVAGVWVHQCLRIPRLSFMHHSAGEPFFRSKKVSQEFRANRYIPEHRVFLVNRADPIRN
jgi:hypothetical protein